MLVVIDTNVLVSAVVPRPLDIPFTDEADRKFYEVSKQCGAILITGNSRHFPEEALVQSVPVFLATYKKSHSLITYGGENKPAE